MSKDKLARIYHADLWGSREEKYAWLSEHDWKHTPWEELHPGPEFYLFVPTGKTALEQYNTFPKVIEIFPVYSVGIVTARDRLTIRWTPEEVWTTVFNFSRMDPELAREGYGLGGKVSRERILRAQEDLKKTGPSRDHIVPILYRPFDVRYTYYTGTANGFHERPRPEVMRHMLAGENAGLIVMRQVALDEDFTHVFVTKHLVDNRAFVSAKGITQVHPLYLYLSAEKRELFKEREELIRRPNLGKEIMDLLAEIYGKEPTPEDIFHYVYAVLYAPSYREKYAEFLRIDFPRIPFTSDYELFRKMAELGRRLVDLHLLRSPELDPPIARFQGEGDGKVETGKKGLRYAPESKRVYINETQYFEGVPPEVWEYRIGGYQVCHKWLKDRRNRDKGLSADEIRTYCRIVTALAQTIEIQEHIDKTFLHEGLISEEGRDHGN